MSLFDILLKLFNFVLLFFELCDKIIELFLQEIVLLNTIQVINSDSGNLIGEILDFDFFLSYVLIGLFRLFEKISRTLLDGLLLRSMIDDVVSDFLSFGVKTHDTFLEDVHFLLNVGFLDVHAAGFILCLSDGGLEHHELFIESF